MCCDPAARAERMRQRAEYRRVKAEYRVAKRQLKMERKQEKMRVKYDVVRSVLGEQKPEQQRQQPALLMQTHTQAQTSNEARRVAGGQLAREGKPAAVADTTAREREEEGSADTPSGAPPSYERVMRETGTEKKTRNSMAMTERSAVPAPTASSGSSSTRTSSSSSTSTSSDSRGLVGMMRDMALSQLQTRLDAADDRSRRVHLQRQSHNYGSCGDCNARAACGHGHGHGCANSYAEHRRQGLLGMVISGVMEAAQAKSRESRSGGSVKFDLMSRR